MLVNESDRGSPLIVKTGTRCEAPDWSWPDSCHPLPDFASSQALCSPCAVDGKCACTLFTHTRLSHESSVNRNTAAVGLGWQGGEGTVGKKEKKKKKNSFQFPQPSAVSPV